jgi:hypothetical protein
MIVEKYVIDSGDHRSHEELRYSKQDLDLSELDRKGLVQRLKSIALYSRL